ncbi:hypothetical protein CFOL_v3_35226 [Cephalotus follicularis]|uniref:Uncharacterized protein n=1 Tax=Cephalotus follicularis TaxID=3775 RepID=A0A1Q3DH66_CEPFO|nr:hypothetical protein CFOL_v3_35226 [Cephalotus follicularis]
MGLLGYFHLYLIFVIDFDISSFFVFFSFELQSVTDSLPAIPINNNPTKLACFSAFLYQMGLAACREEGIFTGSCKYSCAQQFSEKSSLEPIIQPSELPTLLTRQRSQNRTKERSLVGSNRELRREQWASMLFRFWNLLS